MAHIAGSPQIGIRFRTTSDPVRLEFPDEQQHLAAALPVMDIPLPSCGILSCRTLALPVEQTFVDRIVVVHSGWRIVLVSLIERNKEHIQLLLRQPLHALTNCSRLQKIQGNQQLVTGIGAVQIQRAIEAQVNRFINKVNLSSII